MKNKFRLIILIFVCFLSLFMIACKNENHTQYTEGIQYSLSSDGSYYYVSRYNGDRSNVVIAPKYNDFPVRSIGQSAFSKCELLESIKIPEGVTSIEDYAFGGCSNLVNIEIPKSIISIGYNVFNDCVRLKYNKYNDMRYLGNSKNPYLVLVGGIPNTMAVEVHRNTKLLGNYCFYNLKGLTSVTLPNGVINIGDSAFYNCRKLAHIKIPNSVTSIGNKAFYNCSSLETAVIPKSVTNIGEHAFYGCTELIIYCEVNSRPIGWERQWYNEVKKIVWGYKES